MSQAKRTVVLGLVFLLCLVLAYVENRSFFDYSGDDFARASLFRKWLKMVLILL